jgi:hypothetical protein
MVGLSLCRSIRRRLRAVGVWVMVPLAFSSGVPVSGCICADGHYEPICRADLCQGGQTGETQKPLTAACCGCSCCAPGKSEGSRHCCTDNNTACCRGSANSSRNDSSGNGVQGKGCCTPFVQAQVIPPITASPSLPDDHHSTAIGATTLDLPRLVVTTNASRRVEMDIGPPPDDLVVSLGRLLI